MMETTLQAWRTSGREWAYGGHRVFYQLHGTPGSQPALLCIHGFPTASWDWHAIWSGLCEHFGCVVAPDMIGFGYSAKPARYEYSILDQATLHEQLLREIGIARVHLLAHDYGDTVAQELLARHHDRQARGDASLIIESGVFLNGGLFPEAHRARFVQKLMLSPLGPLLSRFTSEAQFRRSFCAVLGPRTQPSEQELREFWQLITHESGQRRFHQLIGYIPERRRHRERWVGALTTAPLPLRFINGPMDPVSGAHMAARYRELVPQPDVVLLADHIGHYPQLEDPQGTLVAFLDFHRRRAAPESPRYPVPEHPVRTPGFGFSL